MLFDEKRPTGISAAMWEVMGPNSSGGNKINDIDATSDHKWLFAACGKGWWAMFDLEQDKCVCRLHCMLTRDGYTSCPMSVAVSPDDQLFYMVTNSGIVKSYDIQAAEPRGMNSISSQRFEKITVDPNNQFIFIACESGNFYKYDTG